MKATRPTLRFSPDSVFWRVNREGLLALAGARALLLEVAHPLIAAGVVEHSQFRRQPLGRLLRTAWTMTVLTFGDETQGRRGARHFARCHAPVRGVLREGVGPYPAGTEYDAADPFLKLWVLATLIDSVLCVHELCIAPLSCAERQAYYRDSQRLGEWFGLSAALMPATYHGFEGYVQAMLDSELLVVGPAAREIAATLYPRAWWGGAVRLASFVGIGLLPERLRAAYGFEWTAHQETRLQRAAAWLRRARPALPALLCVNPLALAAEAQRRLLQPSLTNPNRL
jgi:uncharacterized protein (DUF2236 family)